MNLSDNLLGVKVGQNIIIGTDPTSRAGGGNSNVRHFYSEK